MNAPVHCYSIMLSESLIEDADSLTWTPVNLLLEVGVSRLGVTVPWVTTLHFLADSTVPENISADLRVLIQERVSGEQTVTGPYSFNMGQRRARCKIRGFQIPGKAGDYSISAQVRLPESRDWISSEATWYLLVREIVPSAEGAPAQLAATE